jgi:hypothetical protein
MPYLRLVLSFVLVLPEVVQAREIEFVTEELPWAVIGKGYTGQPLEVRISGMCPMGGVGYSIVGGLLPPGMQFSRLGYFFGTPSQTGVFDFNVRVSNGCSWTARLYTITVADPPELKVSPAHLEFNENSLKEQDVRVSAGWPKLAYQATAGSDWLKAAPQNGFTPEDVVHVRVDASQLKPGTYSTVLTLSAWQAAASPTVSVTLTVK